MYHITAFRTQRVKSVHWSKTSLVFNMRPWLSHETFCFPYNEGTGGSTTMVVIDCWITQVCTISCIGARIKVNFLVLRCRLVMYCIHHHLAVLLKLTQSHLQPCQAFHVATNEEFDTILNFTNSTYLLIY